jgi:hypothetical protein
MISPTIYKYGYIAALTARDQYVITPERVRHIRCEAWYIRELQHDHLLHR